MIFQMGWRNIWRNKRRTAVILTAVIIGVWSMIFLGALMRGMSDRMRQNGIATLTGHLQIHAAGFRKDPVIENRITSPEKVYRALAALPGDAHWAERIRVSAVASNARHSAGVTLVGIDPVREAAVSFIGDAVGQGRYLQQTDPLGIVVGEALARKFETRIGHKLVLMSQDARGEIASRAFRIVGTYRAELESTEKQFVFVHIGAAQQMLGVGDDICEVAVLLGSHRQVDETAARLRRQLPGDAYTVETWKDLLPIVQAMLQMHDSFIFIWFLAVFIAMGFGLVNTILMAVFERMREFGLMRALGMRARLVVAEVLAESFFLLVIGMAAGNFFGLLSVLALSVRGIDLSAFSAGMEFVGMSRVVFPLLTMHDIVTANVTVFFMGLAVSLYPAIKAARISPVEAMVYQ
ncbi:MAG: ABC transporter permease [Desulfobacterales bacterium]|jgi:ABC-type lipoprotein release transport system permease subunit